MAMPAGEQMIPTDEHLHGPGQSTLGVDVDTLEATSDSGSAVEPVSAEKASADSTQQQQAGTATPSGLESKRLFPSVEWNIPYAPSPLEGHPECASIAPRAGSDPPTRMERVPYVPGEDLGVSTAWGMEGMPAILMYAPERSLLSGFAGSTASESGAAPAENLVLCVVEDAFERAWVAPQGYWRSAFQRGGLGILVV